MNNTPNLDAILDGADDDSTQTDKAIAELANLKNEIETAIWILKYFDDGCGCVAICKEGPCPSCMARDFIKRNS